jgi:hypothetical protein
MQAKALWLVMVWVGFFALCAGSGYAGEAQNSPMMGGSAAAAGSGTQMKMGGGSNGINEGDYEKCVSFCQKKFAGNSPELTACIQGCSNVPDAHTGGGMKMQ